MRIGSLSIIPTAPDPPRHRKGSRIDNGATEQVFGHMKYGFFRGRTWADFEPFEADLDACVAHWDTRRRQVKLKGLTPEEFRNQSLRAAQAALLARPSFGAQFTTVPGP